MTAAPRALAEIRRRPTTPIFPAMALPRSGILHAREVGTLAGLLALCVALWAATPHFATVSNLVINVDIRCQEVPVELLNERFDVAMRVPLSPDWGFSWSDSYSDADGSISARFDGRLAVGGPASGTFRIDLALNISGLGTVHCSTGDVTWTASPPA